MSSRIEPSSPLRSRFFSSGTLSDSESDIDQEKISSIEKNNIAPAPFPSASGLKLTSSFIEFFSENKDSYFPSRNSEATPLSGTVTAMVRPDSAGFEEVSHQTSSQRTPEKVRALKELAQNPPYRMSVEQVKVLKCGLDQLSQLLSPEKSRQKTEIRRVIFSNASENYSQQKVMVGGKEIPFSPVKRQKISEPSDSPSKSPSKLSTDRHRELYFTLPPNSIEFAILKETYGDQAFALVNTRHIFKGDRGEKGTGGIKGKHVFRGKKDLQKIARVTRSSQHGVSQVVWIPERSQLDVPEVTKTSTAFSPSLSDEQILSRIIKSRPIAQVANTQLRRGSESDYYEVYLGEGSSSKINSAFPLFYYARYFSNGKKSKGEHIYQILLEGKPFFKGEIKQAIVKVVNDAFKKLQEGRLNDSENPVRYFLMSKRNMVIDIAPAIAERTGVEKGIFIEVSSKDGLGQDLYQKIQTLGQSRGVF